MRTMTGLAMVALMLIAPATVSAGTFGAGQDFLVPSTQQVLGNLHVAAGTVTIGGPIAGDLYAAGGTISVAGAISGDVGAVGGTVQVLDHVYGDVRVVAGQVTLDDLIDGDVVVAGGTLHILPGTIIVGDVSVAGGEVIVDGAIRGALTVVGGRVTMNGVVDGPADIRVNEMLSIGSGARLAQGLDYRAPAEATIADGAIIRGDVAYTKVAGPKVRFDSKAPRALGNAIADAVSAMRLITLLAMAALLLWLWRRPTLALMASTHEKFWSSAGHGLVYLILTPIAAFLLMISFIGVWPGLLALLTLSILCILAKVIAGMYLGAWLMSKYKKTTALHLTWLSGLGGVILLAIVAAIPVIGWLVGFVLFLAVFGALATAVRHKLASM